MYYFYPGPSKVYPFVRELLLEAYDSGILSMNHRSSAFSDLMAATVQNLREKLNIPADYGVYFVSSATETWQIIGQSWHTLHFWHCYNGAFGEKWYKINQQLGNKTQNIVFEVENEPTFDKNTSHYNFGQEDMICFTENETSNGTQLNESFFENFRNRFPQTLVAVDATSSLGGKKTAWQAIDIVFASVQKCLGLPSGLGLLICSPRAVEKALAIKANHHYNSFWNLHQNMSKFQTTHTPNMLAIYLLNSVLEKILPIDALHKRLVGQANEWYDFLEANNYRRLVSNRAVVSQTVIAVSFPENQLDDLKNKAQESGFYVGNGYGEWKNNSFRIANFPALETHEIEALKLFLKNYQILGHS